VQGTDGVEVETLWGDMAYSDGDVREVVEEQGVELVAKVPPVTNAGRFPKNDFDIDLAARMGHVWGTKSPIGRQGLISLLRARTGGTVNGARPTVGCVLLGRVPDVDRGRLWQQTLLSGDRNRSTVGPTARAHRRVSPRGREDASRSLGRSIPCGSASECPDPCPVAALFRRGPPRWVGRCPERAVRRRSPWSGWKRLSHHLAVQAGEGYARVADVDVARSGLSRSAVRRIRKDLEIKPHLADGFRISSDRR
jgi:hypothetical protein